MKTHLLTLILLALLFLVGYAMPNAAAQPIGQVATPSAACTLLVDQAESRVQSVCDALGRNQACYGNQTVEVDFQPGSNLVFNASGDVVDLLSVRRVSTTPLDLQTQDWGIAVLKAQANLPQALPGENVTFILFNDTSVENPSPDMRAVVVSTRIGSVDCSNAPDSAVLIQSPTGRQVTMNLNGADVTLGSTAYVTAEEGGDMTFAIIEGVGIISGFDTVRVVTRGMQVHLPLGTGDGLHIIGAPSEPEPFDQDAIDRAPLNLLDRPVEAPSSGTPTLTPSANAQTCLPRTDWTFIYTIRYGDTLSGIAQRAGVTTATLASGNCIVNLNLLYVGQTLRTPRSVPPPPIVTPISSLTPIGIPTTSVTTIPAPTAYISASPPSIVPPQCATLTWTTTNAASVTLDNVPVSNNGSQLACPTTDTTYMLTVIGMNNTSTSASVTVMIDSVCGNNICEADEDYATCPSDCG